MRVEKYVFQNLDKVDKQDEAAAFEEGIEKAVSKVVEEANQENNQASADVGKVIHPEQQEQKQEVGEKDILQARTQGYEEGYAKGYDAAKSATEEMENNIKKALIAVSTELANIRQQVTTVNKDSASDVAKVALLFAKKLVGDAIEKEPLPILLANVERALNMLLGEPNIVIEVNSDMLARLLDRLEEIIEKNGFKGKVAVKGKDSLGACDCTISWDGGQMVRSDSAIWQDIENICLKF